MQTMRYVWTRHLRTKYHSVFQRSLNRLCLDFINVWYSFLNIKRYIITLILTKAVSFNYARTLITTVAIAKLMNRACVPM